MENTKQTQYHAAAYVRLSKEDLNSVSGLKAESNSISNQKQPIPIGPYHTEVLR